MSLARDIAFDYLGEHPVQAARALEVCGDAEVAALLKEAETEDLAAVLAALSPGVSAEQLGMLPIDRAVEAVASLGAERGAVLVRRVPGVRRREILEALPASEREALAKLLRYPEGTAGALMDPRVASFHRDQLASDALEGVRARWRDLRYYVFVFDDAHRLSGVLSVRELVAAPPEARLASVMHRPVVSLSARASESAILKHPGWARFPQLPVVDESDRLLGVLRYRTFRAIQEPAAGEAPPGPLGLALALGELFWLGASGMFRGLAPEGEDERPAS